MIMDGPIPIKKDQEPEFSPTAEEWLAFKKQQHLHRQQWAFMFILGMIVAAVAIPLGVWLTRLALGG